MLSTEKQCFVHGTQLVMLLVEAEEMPRCRCAVLSLVGSAIVRGFCATVPAKMILLLWELHPAANMGMRRPAHWALCYDIWLYTTASRRLRRDHVVQARELYRLLVEDSTAIRHAAAELVAGMLEPQGQRFLAQVGSACIPLHVVPFLPWGSFRFPLTQSLLCRFFSNGG